MRTELKLCDNFNFFVNVVDKNELPVLCEMVDIRTCEVTLVPSEVAQNRKRRWSKKFPVMVACSSELVKFKVYLFSPTAREKEDWFRRLKSAADKFTSQQVIDKQKDFFVYMQKYFPTETLRDITLTPAACPHTSPTPSRKSLGRGVARGHSSNHKHMAANTLVQFSKSADSDEFSDSSEPPRGVNITHGPIPHLLAPDDTTPRRLSPTSLHRKAAPSSPSGSELSSLQKEAHLNVPLREQERDQPKGAHRHVHTDSRSTSLPPPSATRLPRTIPRRVESLQNQWLNAIAARLCWDMWHEQRWKDWVMTRIQKKLIRVKTPSFMEQLQLTNVDIGSDMPLLNQLIGGPRLDLHGIWIYLDVTYRGRFVMTIETKMKLGGNSLAGSGGKEEEGQQMTSMAFKAKEESR